MERTRARFQRAGRQIAPALESRLKENLIRKLVEEELIAQKAKAEGVSLDKAEIDAKLTEHKGRFGSDKAFQSFLERTQQSEADVRSDLEKNLLRDKLFAKLLSGQEPTEDDAKKYYDENKDKYKQREQINAQHILFKIDKTTSDADKKKKLSEAKKVLAEAKKPGADFAALAKKYSEGPTAQRGGDLGTFSRGRMVKQFEDAAFAAKPGEIVGPVETQFGYHIIKVNSKNPEVQRPYDEVKDSILTSLKARQKSKATRELLDKLKADAKIENPRARRLHRAPPADHDGRQARGPRGPRQRARAGQEGRRGRQGFLRLEMTRSGRALVVGRAPVAARALRASCACLALASCASAQTAGGGAATTGVEPVDIDPILLDETVGLTAELIRAHAVNPPGEEKRVVDVLAATLQDAGLDVVTAPFGGDARRANLKAVLHGRDPTAPPLLLLGHSDVVPADAAEWSVPPFDGAIQGGRLIGRGAFDMLSMDALEALTLVALKRGGTTLERDVVLVIEGDEEVGGEGMKQALVDWPELKKAAFALTEGGAFLESYLRPGEDLAAVAVAEKGLFQFSLTAHGKSGHGSTPVDDAAPDRIIRAAARVLDRDVRFTITPIAARQLADIGAAHGGIEGVVLSSPALAKAFARPLLDATPSSAALFRDTCSLTVLDAGQKRNVIPGTASATFDCRLLPGTDPHAFRDRMLAIVDDPRVDLTVLEAAPASGSAPDSPVVDALRARIKREIPGAAVVATLSKAATDCRFVRKAGVPCYGFIPILITREELDAVHGKDESVRTEELAKALPRLVDVVAALATVAPTTAPGAARSSPPGSP